MIRTSVLDGKPVKSYLGAPCTTARAARGRPCLLTMHKAIYATSSALSTTSRCSRKAWTRLRFRATPRRVPLRLHCLGHGPDKSSADSAAGIGRWPQGRRGGPFPAAAPSPADVDDPARLRWDSYRRSQPQAVGAGLFWGAGAALLVWNAVMLATAGRRGRRLSIEVACASSTMCRPALS